MSTRHILTSNIEPRYDASFNTVTLSSGLTIIPGAASGRVLTSNAIGFGSWQSPAPSGFAPRTYLYEKNLPETLGPPGQELAISFNSVIFQDPAADVTNNFNGTVTFNNAGIYLVVQSIKVSNAFGSSIGMAFAINGNPERYATTLGGSDPNWNGSASGSQIFSVNAGDAVFTLANVTVSSTGQDVGGGGAVSSFLSIVRLA